MFVEKKSVPCFGSLYSFPRPCKKIEESTLPLLLPVTRVNYNQLDFYYIYIFFCFLLLSFLC